MSNEDKHNKKKLINDKYFVVDQGQAIKVGTHGEQKREDKLRSQHGVCVHYSA